MCPPDARPFWRVCLDAAPGVYALVLSPPIFTDRRYAIEERTEHTPSPPAREPEHVQNVKAINEKIKLNATRYRINTQRVNIRVTLLENEVVLSWYV